MIHDGAVPRGGGGGPAVYTEDVCRRHTGDLRDVCFAALARQRAPRDLDGALTACGEVVTDRLRFECLADVAEFHSLSSLDDARNVCPSIPTRKWRDQCFFGIATALVATDPPLALATCNDAGMWRDFCRHDVLGEASTRDLDWVLSVCGREEGDILTRKTCWHGIGKYIGRKDEQAAAAACRRVPEGPSGLYRENCFHGLGWALGERMEAGGVSLCPLAGPQEDSCRLGVAYEVRTVQADAALSICQSVGRSDLKDQCLRFVRSVVQ